MFYDFQKIVVIFMAISLLQYFHSFAPITVLRIISLGYPKCNYYYPADSNMMVIEEKLVLSIYFFYAKEHFVI